jgi:hypothetical protein
MLTKTRKLVRGQEALAALLAEGLDMAGWIVPALHQAASGRVAVNRANAFDDAVGRHWLCPPNKMMQFDDVAFGHNVEFDAADLGGGVIAKIISIVDRRPGLQLGDRFLGEVSLGEFAESRHFSGARA